MQENYLNLPSSKGVIVKQTPVASKVFSKPPPAHLLTDKQLLKEHFYLERFLKTLESNSNMPTLPNSSLLEAIKQENDLMQQTVEAHRSGNYEKYLMNKLNALSHQAQMLTHSVRQFNSDRKMEKKIFKKS